MAETPANWIPRDSGTVTTDNESVERTEENGTVRIEQDGTVRVLQPNVVIGKVPAEWSDEA